MEGPTPLPEKKLPLSKIIAAFGIGINEEQSWAVLHQACSCFLRQQDVSRGLHSFDVDNIFLDKEGSVTVENIQSVTTEAAKEDDDEKENKELQPDDVDLSEEGFLQQLAFALYEACQYGLSSKQEATLSTDLKSLLERMASESYSDIPQPSKPLQFVLQKIRERNREDYYQAVCRALVVECCDLLSFLKHVKTDTNQVRKLDGRNNLLVSSGKEVVALPAKDEFRTWAKHWVRVMESLREGVQLRKVARDNELEPRSDEHGPTVYELTPYEMLMEDIRLRRFSLKTTVINDEELVRMRLEPHDIILEYIKSRPPLSPAAKRRLKPKIETPTPAEALMDSIRMFSHEALRRTPVVTPVPSRRGSKSNLTTSTACSLNHLLPAILMEPATADVDSTMTDAGDGLTPRRKLVIPDMEASPTLDFLIEERDNEDPEHHDQSHSYEDMSITNGRPGYSEVVSLTLDEIALIRGALAKAELENLEEQDQRLFDSVRQQKICFSCKRVRFGTWWMRQRGVKCHLCQNTICTDCCRQMVLPCAQLDRIPVHTLSPALEPDQQDERHLRDNIPFTPSPNRDKRMIASSTVPRQKLQRSMTHDFTTCATMPKAQTRQRLPLQAGLAISAGSSTLPRPPGSSLNHSPLSVAQRRKISLPSEEPTLLIQVCIECHNVLYHAIMESQAERFSLHTSRVHQLTSGLDTRQRRPMPLRSATMTELGPLSTAASYHTSASSVISDSQSDSLDEDFNAADMEDFLEDIQAHARQSELLQAQSVSVSPGASRSDSTNSEAGSFYSNHI